MSTSRSTKDTNMDGDLDQPDTIKHRSSLSHSLHEVGVGDRGQRYEVRYTDEETGKERVVGWTDRADGGGLMRAARQWPVVKERPDGTRVVWLVDRYATVSGPSNEPAADTTKLSKRRADATEGTWWGKMRPANRQDNLLIEAGGIVQSLLGRHLRRLWKVVEIKPDGGLVGRRVSWKTGEVLPGRAHPITVEVVRLVPRETKTENDSTRGELA